MPNEDLLRAGTIQASPPPKEERLFGFEIPVTPSAEFPTGRAKAYFPGNTEAEAALVMESRLNPPPELLHPSARMDTRGFTGPPDQRINFAPIRQGIVGATGMAGTAVGAGMTAIPTALAGTPVGAAAGGLVGDMGGSLLADAAESTIRAVPFLNERIRTTNPGGMADGLERALSEGATGLLFGDVLAAGGRALRTPNKTLTRRSLDLESVAAAEEAALEGVPLGAQNVTKSRAIAGVHKIFGAFPFISKPFRVAHEGATTAVSKARDRLWLTLGPSVHSTELGVDMHKVASKRFSWITKHWENQYEDWFQGARAAETSVPTSRLHRAFDQMEEVADRATNRSLRVDPIDGTSELVPIRKTDDAAGDFVGRYRDLEPNMSMDQLRRFSSELDKAMDRASGLGDTVKDSEALESLLKVKKALEQTMQEDIPGEAGDSYRALTKAYGETMDFFRGPEAQRFGRVTKGVFGPQLNKPGSKNADELYDIAWNTKSPQALKDLRVLVGDDLYRASSRRHIENVMLTSLREKPGPAGQILETFDTNAVRKTFGMLNKSSNEYAAFKEMLRGSGVRAWEVEAFLKATDLATAAGLPNVSQFLTRRIVLGGIRSGVSGLLPGSAILGGSAGAGAAAAGTIGAVGGTLGAVGMSLYLKRLGKVISDPGMLKEMTKIIREETAIATGVASRDVIMRNAFKQGRRHNFARLARHFLSIDADQERGDPTRGNQDAPLPGTFSGMRRALESAGGAPLQKAIDSDEAQLLRAYGNRAGRAIQNTAKDLRNR